MPCAGTASGAKSELLLWFEDSYKVDPVTVVAYKMPIISETLNATRSLISSPVINGRRDPKRPTQGNLTVSGDIVVPIDKENLGMWLKALMGDPVTLGSGPYVHTFKVDNTNCLPSFAVEKKIDDVRFFKYSGLRINQISFSTGGDEYPQMTLSVIGSSMTDTATSEDASPTVLSLVPFSAFQAEVNEGGVANLEMLNIDMTVSNNLDSSLFTIGGGGVLGALPEGDMAISGTSNVLFNDMALYNKGRDFVESSVEIIFTDGAHSITFDMPEVVFDFTSPQISGPQGIQRSVAFNSYFDNGAGDSALIITLVNGLVSYP